MRNGHEGTFLQLKTRREPPERLTVDEKRIWNKLVEDKPSEWFCEDNLVLLEQYVKVVMRLQGFIGLLAVATDVVVAGGFEDNEAKKVALGELKLFNSLVSQTTKDLNMIARNLRFTPYSRYDSRFAASAVKKETKDVEGNPWEIDTGMALAVAGQSSKMKKMDWDKVQ